MWFLLSLKIFIIEDDSLDAENGRFKPNISIDLFSFSSFNGVFLFRRYPPIE